jgi:hypothetical protein
MKKLIMVSLLFMKPKSPPLSLTIQIFFFHLISRTFVSAVLVSSCIFV